MKPKFLLTGARIIPLDGTAHVLNGVDIWIADGRIAALSPRGSSPPYEGDYKPSLSTIL